ncbi:flagellar basal body rod protein FlgB [Nitrospirillum sp. BR 11828]|uniref:flagellar basal body rod protein FlgB n=1 Tax=Nitrospirillum sp. BR 11828 TaxID=3104325 RepID=UPI002ACAF3BC|nr:flagellar basal body rod protein FlgB [Nitrospirillum sp. BR 11828]MDZ5648184.1 flagellar basal body rod protein FlgB [Nitrospirillum sp. BR 11828]
MDLNRLGIFKLMSDKMAWDNQRQEVLAQNVSNSDTPNYQARDLVPFDFKNQLREAGKLELVATDPAHLASSGTGAGGFRAAKDRTAYETSPTGNAVVLEDQMTKIGQNAIDFQALTNLYRKQIGMLKMALGKGS